MHAWRIAGCALLCLCACGKSKNETAAAPHSDSQPSSTAAPRANAPPAKPGSAPMYAPLVIRLQSGPVVSSACLSLEEIKPDDGFGGVQPVFDVEFKALEKQFANQPHHILSQRIAHVFAFDDFVIVYQQLQRDDGERTWPYTFAWSPDGKLAPWSDGHAEKKPDGSTKVTITDADTRIDKVLVRDWLEDASPGNVDPPHCAADVVQHATHRLPIGPESSRATRLQLLLRGAPIDSPGELRPIAERVTATFKSIEQALTAQDFDALAKHLTEASATQLRKWWETASADDRARYFKTIMQDEVPFFVFDASPLILVYTRHGTAAHEQYFVMSGTDVLEWDNNPPITDGRRLFTRGPLRDAAALPEPFSTLRIQ